MIEQIAYWIKAGLLCDRSCFRVRTGICCGFYRIIFGQL